MALEEEKAKVELEAAKEQASKEAQERQEQAILEAAARLAAAREISPEAEEDLREARSESDRAVDEVAQEGAALTASEVLDWPFSQQILRTASNVNDGHIRQVGFGLSYYDVLKRDNVTKRIGENHRDALALGVTIENLAEAGLLVRRNDKQFEMTQAGYDMLDNIRMHQEELEEVG